MSKVETVLRRAGRQRNLTAAAERIVAALQTEQLSARPGLVAAYGASTAALVAVIGALAAQVSVLEAQVSACFGRHPDAEIYLSQPGLGQVLGARGARRVR